MSAPSWSPRHRPTATRCCWARSAPPSPTSTSTRPCPTTAPRASRRWRWSARWPTCSPCIQSFPAKTLKEFVDYCKAQGPNKVSYGSPAVGGTGHLAMEYLSELAGIKLEHVVYRGSSLVMKDLLAGHILDHHGQPAALPAAHPVGCAARARRQLGQALVRGARRADHRRAGLSRLRRRALVVRGRAGRHAGRHRQEAVGRDHQGHQVRGRDQEDPRDRRGRAAGRRSGAGEADEVARTSNGRR